MSCRFDRCVFENVATVFLDGVDDATGAACIGACRSSGGGMLSTYAQRVFDDPRLV